MEIISENKPFAYKNQDIGQGRGVYISTYGCQMNVNDSDRMYSLLEMANFTPVDSPLEASVIIINSCSIREKPVHKVYSEVGKYRKLKDANPKLKIGIGGCVGQQEKEKLIKNQPMIDFVFGTDTIDTLPDILNDLILKEESKDDKKNRIVKAGFAHREPYHVETLVRNPGVSTFVNITKGCDNFCTFCVVPFTRGREKSRPKTHVLQDIHTLVKRGVKEVTLLGQNVNSYESECGTSFADLMKTIAKETGIERIRFTTSHPKDFDQYLVDVIAEHQDKICEYIHLPFQSGNSRILERMNRGYTREQYIEKINMIKKTIPNVVLSTDIICGFPGETEADFQDTLSMVREVGYETIFAFMYSQRPNTKAAKFEDQVPDAIKSERLQRLFDAHNTMAFDLAKAYENRILDVLVEKKHDDESVAGNIKFSGRSRQNKLVYFEVPAAHSDLIGRTVNIKITKAYPAVFRGDMVGSIN
ncbi:MAG: tRNA (N6-isopentenyl adenosine(37)-C2)-methylthiotransferase MiaB [Bdellovibrionaceae bacterium]|nr:tRNA (N6-isopentenyl adenosine(37)-C2)-methylthiotransferase MiaB [Pseudobdellovibrionaceae bacterium]